MKLAICGPGRSGKDTVSLWLKNHTILRYGGSTSEAAAQLCYEKLLAEHPYASVAECFADRHNHRVAWANIIWEYNKPDGITLYRDMLVTSDILNGIRRKGEIQALQKRALIDLTIWVARDVLPDPSCELLHTDADIAIYNYGTLEELYSKLSRLAYALDIWG